MSVECHHKEGSLTCVLHLSKVGKRQTEAWKKIHYSNIDIIHEVFFERNRLAVLRLSKSVYRGTEDHVILSNAY